MRDPLWRFRHVPAGSAPEGGAASGQSGDLDPGPAPGESAQGRGTCPGSLSGSRGGESGRLAGVRPESRVRGRSAESSRSAQGPVTRPGYGPLWPDPGGGPGAARRTRVTPGRGGARQLGGCSVLPAQRLSPA